MRRVRRALDRHQQQLAHRARAALDGRDAARRPVEPEARVGHRAVVAGREVRAGRERRAHLRRLHRLLQVAVEHAVLVEPALDGLQEVVVPREVGDRQQHGQRAHGHPARSRAPAREHRPAGDREPVEERQQDGRGGDVAADQRQPEERPDGEHRHHRGHDRERQDGALAGVQPREHEPDRDAEHERLAQHVAEVLRGPVRHVAEAAAAVVGDREVGGAVQGVQRVAGDGPVRPGPDQRRARRQRDRDRARARVAVAPDPEHVQAREHPGLRPQQARDGEQGEHRRAPPRRPRLQQHRADHERRERQVLVGEHRVALERGPREHHERRHEAHPRGEQLPPEREREVDERAEGDAASRTPSRRRRRRRTAAPAARTPSAADAGSARRRPCTRARGRWRGPAPTAARSGRRSWRTTARRRGRARRRRAGRSPRRARSGGPSSSRGDDSDRRPARLGKVPAVFVVLAVAPVLQGATMLAAAAAAVDGARRARPAPARRGDGGGARVLRPGGGLAGVEPARRARRCWPAARWPAIVALVALAALLVRRPALVGPARPGRAAVPGPADARRRHGEPAAAPLRRHRRRRPGRGVALAAARPRPRGARRRRAPRPRHAAPRADRARGGRRPLRAAGRLLLRPRGRAQERLPLLRAVRGAVPAAVRRGVERRARCATPSG